MVYAILEPGNHPPRPGARPILNLADLSSAQILGLCRPAGGVLVLDLETQGVRVWDPSQLVVGVALADAESTCYLHIGIEADGQAAWYELLQQLAFEKTPLIAFNVQFDAAWMSRDLAIACRAKPGKPWDPSAKGAWDQPIPWHNWYACAFAAYKHFASEGFMGQRHGLKQAMVEMLGWEESNEAELDAWLCDNGYGRWTNEKQAAGGVLRVAHPNKGEMWRAPRDTLGSYAARDAEATWLLWNRIIKPAWDLFDAYRVYHQEWLCGPQGLQMHLVWQKLRGVSIDAQKLGALHEGLTARLGELDEAFRTHPQVAEHIAAYDAAVVEDVRAGEPARWKKMPVLGAEPDKQTKKGDVSKAWLSWAAKRQALEQLMRDIEATAGSPAVGTAAEQESAHYRGWLEKLRVAQATQHFNPNSDLQLRELFYDKLGFPALVFTPNENNPQPAVSEDALKGFGDAGKLLIQHGSLEKLRSSLVSLQERLADGTDGDTYHPELRTPGTHTGRLSGSGGYNFQNVPKCKELLECFVARPGCVLMFADIAALEPAVLAQRSHDVTYMSLYGPDAKPNDVYLAVAANLGGDLGKRIRATGYDPAAPTKEAVAKAKKEAKKERNIAKTLHLAAGYGAGAGKIRMGLAEQGIEMSLYEAKKMHTAYWQLFAQVKAFGRWLEAQWERNDGWWLNGIGRPICVAEDFKRDIINRDVQSCGHDVFMLFTMVLAQELNARGIWFAPWCWDLHDCCALECRQEDVEAVREVVDKIVPARVAQVLGGDVKLKWESNFVSNWAGDKLEAGSVAEQGVHIPDAPAPQGVRI